MRAAFVAVALCLAVSASAASPIAVARLWPAATSGVAGIVAFTPQDDGTTRVDVALTGVTPGNHGLHVHQFGDITDQTGTAAGAHFNPAGKLHACLGGNSGNQHVGDLGNVTADSNGVVNATFFTPYFNLTWNPDTAGTALDQNIIGRGVILHANPDDCMTQSTGNAGARAAMGVIGTAQGTGYGIASAATSNSIVGRLYNNAGTPIGNVTFWTDAQTSAKSLFIRAIPGAVDAFSIHGVHVHAFGDQTDLTSAGASFGGHHNPFSQPHRVPYEGNNRHAGDLGSVVGLPDGSIYHFVQFDSSSPLVLNQAWGNIVGHGFVLHSTFDSGFVAQPTGNAGTRPATAVLGLSNSVPVVGANPFNVTSAYARLFPTRSYGPTGATGGVRFAWTDRNTVQITAQISGLTASSTYAMHIHEIGDLNSVDGTKTLAHYNPYSFLHACYPNNVTRHVGDIGNVVADSNGVVNWQGERDWIQLWGPNSVIGRAVMIHAAADDCSNPTTGNAGNRIMQSVIGVENPANFYDATATQLSVNPGTYSQRNITVLNAMVMPTTVAAANGVSPTGWVWFTENPAGTTNVLVNITGAGSATKHGLHVHTYGDWTNPNGATAGLHWNPLGYGHALPSQEANRHAGDLGNVIPDANGNILTLITVTNMPIAGIIGRGIVLHNAEDLGTADPVNFGPRVGLGVIGITAATFPTIPVESSSSSTGSVESSSSSTAPCLTDDTCSAAGMASSFAAVAVAIAVAQRMMHF